MQYNLQSVITELKNIAFYAGKYMLDVKNTKYIVNTKTSFRDLVTTIDLKIETMIVKHLHKLYKNASFFAEELNNVGNITDELVFIIDPIDGTTNFIHDIPYSSIAIGCFIDGIPVAGVVYNPYKNEMFYAVKGYGAYLNDVRIKVTDAHISETLVLFGTSPYDTDMVNSTFEKAQKMYMKCSDIRRFGSAALDICNVACGRAGLYFEGSLSLWDYAASSVILTEAGGVICDYSGMELDYSLNKTSVITGSKRIINESGLLEV